MSDASLVEYIVSASFIGVIVNNYSRSFKNVNMYGKSAENVVENPLDDIAHVF